MLRYDTTTFSTVPSDTYDLDLLSKPRVIWIIDRCYDRVLMGIMWWVCAGGAG
jgi:hypothetical protein